MSSKITLAFGKPNGRKNLQKNLRPFNFQGMIFQTSGIDHIMALYGGGGGVHGLLFDCPQMM